MERTVTKQKIAVVTGSRAEYGLLQLLMQTIKEDPSLELQLIVTGMHLSHEFGHTFRQVELDGFKINEKIEMLLSSDSPVGITKSIGLGVIGFADALSRLKPDLVILLGDRFEIFAAAQSAFIATIPIAHIHGGELTIGAFDDAIRHSITKMSHIHFVAAEEYARRVIQLGEQPERVFNVGPMVLDSIRNMTFLSKEAIEALVKLQLNKNIVVTFHPETLNYYNIADQFGKLLKALALFPDSTIIFTKTNADTNGRIINDMIDSFCENNDHRAKGFLSLGHKNYLSLLKSSDLVMGNSSSGIIEAPYFKIPTVNIGDRQLGRMQAKSVINCEVNVDSIQAAINTAFSIEHQKITQNMNFNFKDEKVASKIIGILKNIDMSTIIKKSFFDFK